MPREEAQGNKAYRIAAKVEWACRTLDLSETFAFWNDDYLLTHDIDIRHIPAWYHGDLFRAQDSEGWQRMLGKTGEALQAAGLSAKHYDIHTPMLFERGKFIAAVAWWDKSRVDSLTMKSVYGNLYCDAYAVPYPDAKLAGQWPHRIDQLTADRPVLSYGDEALRANFADWMAAHYPDAHPAEQVVIAVLGQFRGGTSCVAGLLHALGVSMGSGWRTPRSNIKGTFEGAALGRLCREAFREPALQDRMSPANRIKRFRRWASCRRDPLIGAKHPTLCLCVPQLVVAWPAVRFVAVDRPASESVASMAKAMRSWTPQQAEDGTRRLIQTRDANLATCGRPVIRVSYHDLLANPESITRSLVGFTGVTPDEATIQKAIATVNPKLRTVSAA